MPKIPFLNLATDRKKAAIAPLLEEIGRLAESSDFILGRKVAEFETRFSEREGGAFGIGCNSGLDALILSLKALGVGAGDEVITSPFSFVATGAAISLAGAKPVFADIGWDGTLDPAQVERAVSSKTKAVLPVLWAGIPGALGELRALCDRKNLSLVLDAAQAVGTRVKGRPVGGLGDAVCYSLHPLKNLGVWGDGGMILTQRQGLADRLRLARNHGLVNRDEAEFFSFNSRLDTIQAAVALAQMELLDEVLRARARHARRYLAGLGGIGSLRVPLASLELDSVGVHLFQVVTERREAFRAHLEGRGIETKVHYPILIPFQAAAKDLGYHPGDFPVAEAFAAGVVSLPIREDLEDSEVDWIVRSIREFYLPTEICFQTPSELRS
jgi:dTDP-3-amino-2,3,6-trideoxy-4-keto-D-glucose/dTDP-3-amino-3,4,6-trideoxy-alpha-D-glucose/dTDP-2,6-dideoxy-D-kanosamine transaminase